MIVFDIKRYAINDGPGIRTTLFFKGCPLRCVWCHNPESWLPQPELLFKQKKCIGCNTCGLYPEELGLPMDRYNKRYAREELAAKANNCPAMAIEMCGRDYTLDELLAEVEKERDIMQDSGGGVTLSGGEPFLQMKNEELKMKNEELLSLLHELGRRGFHRCVDTTLYADPEMVKAVAAETDLFLVDLKVMDAEKHKRYTGVSNERILNNLRLLAQLGTPFQLRIPLIDGINSDEENIAATAEFIDELRLMNDEYSVQSSMNDELRLMNDEYSVQSSIINHQSSIINHQSSIKGVALLPYHDAGKDKHARRGTTYNPLGIAMSTPSDATLQRCIRQFAAHGITATIGG